MIHRPLFRTLASSLVAIAAAFFSPSVSAQEPIKIGLVIPLSGPLAIMGVSTPQVAKLWEDETNAAGGILGRPVKFTIYDAGHAFDVSTVRSRYQNVIEKDRVDFIIGGIGRGMLTPAMPVVAKADKIMFGLGGIGANREINFGKFFAVGPQGPPSKEAYTEGFFRIAAAQKPKPTTLAIIASGDDLSARLAEGARQNAQKYRFTIVFDQKYSAEPSELATIIESVRLKDPDIVLICSSPSDSIDIVQAVHKTKFTPKMIGGGMAGLQSSGIRVKLLGQLNGFVNFETWVSEKPTTFEGARELIAKYRTMVSQQTGFSQLDPAAIWTYATLQIIGSAIRDAKTVNGNTLAKYLHTKKLFKTAAGDVGFDERGELSETRIMQVQYLGTKNNNPDHVETVLMPEAFKSGEVIYPYERAK